MMLDIKFILFVQLVFINERLKTEEQSLNNISIHVLVWLCKIQWNPPEAYVVSALVMLHSCLHIKVHPIRATIFFLCKIEWDMAVTVSTSDSFLWKSPCVAVTGRLHEDVPGINLPNIPTFCHLCTNHLWPQVNNNIIIIIIQRFYIALYVSMWYHPNCSNYYPGFCPRSHWRWSMHFKE